MNLMPQTYDAMRLLLRRPMTATEVALMTGRSIHHVRRGLEGLIRYRIVSTDDSGDTRHYALTSQGLDILCERDGVKHTIKYQTTGRIHPNVDWPWTYREAA